MPYNDLYGTAVPWAYALLVGISAAVSEEFVFRVLAISLLKRFIRYNWLAILIPAIVWGFAHCTYPNQPFYIRGIELTIWGVVFGAVFVRFGPLPTLIAHAGFNAILVGESLLGSLMWQPKMNFAVIAGFVLLPFILACWWAWRRGKARENPPDNQAFDQQLALQAAQQTAPIPLNDVEPPRQPISKLAWRLTILVTAIGIAAAIATVDHSGDSTLFHWKKLNGNPLTANLIPRDTAIRLARDALRREQADITGWVLSTATDTYSFDDDMEYYLADYLSNDDIDALSARLSEPASMWEISWQKPLARERWSVRVGMDGAIWDVEHVLSDEAPGAKLSREAALRLAEEALRAKHLKLAHLTLTGKEITQHPGRTIHFFTWEFAGLKIGEAQFLITVQVDGNRVNWIAYNACVPDTYLFELEQETVWETMSSALGVLCAVIIFSLALAIYFISLRRYRMPWKWGMTAALPIPMLIMGIMISTEIYDRSGLGATTAPWADTLVTIIGDVLALSLIGVLLLAILPVVTALWQAQFPAVPGPRFWLGALAHPRQHLPLWREAIIAQCCLVGLMGVLLAIGTLLYQFTSTTGKLAGGHIPDWLVRSLPHLAAYDPSSGLSPLDFLNVIAPPLSLLLLTACASLTGLLVWLIVLTFGKAIFRRARGALLFLALLCALSILPAIGNWKEMVGSFALAFAGVLAAWAIYKLVLRANPLVVPVSIATIFLLMGAWDLLWFPAYPMAGIAILVVLAALYLYAIAGTIAAGRKPLPQVSGEAPPTKPLQAIEPFPEDIATAGEIESVEQDGQPESVPGD